jgi:pentose-5-phosphate-3-epimerase/CBS domain-containing protein
LQQKHCKGVKISASIYSSKDKTLENLVRELDDHRVDYFHIDCNNDLNVFDDIRAIRNISTTPIDLHLITSTPELFYEQIVELGIEKVTLQFENLIPGFIPPEHLNTHLGLAITSETPVGIFEQYSRCFSFILFMTTTPGVSGGRFDKQNFRKIRQFRADFPDKDIHVDGGINEELSFILRNMGVNVAVIGSYLFKGDFIGSALLRLQSNDIESHYRIRDFMLEGDEIPVITANGNFNFLDVLTKIEAYRMGFTNVVDEMGFMLGIISNADVRKALIRHYGDLNCIQAASLINRSPALVCEDNTVTEVLEYIKKLNFPVLFLPVVDRNNKITGTIKFNNLIKGES